jgi:transglutaminase-like putative cysteine protease
MVLREAGGQSISYGSVQIPAGALKSVEVDWNPEHFLGEGDMTGISTHIREYAKGFKGDSLETVWDIVDDLIHFKRKRYDDDGIALVYSKRTADELLTAREVAVSEPKVEGESGDVEGCVDYNLVLCAVLRAKGIPAKFVRHYNHSYTLFHLNDKWCKADPLEGYIKLEKLRRSYGADAELTTEESPLYLMDKVQMANLKRAKRLGVYAEGLDPHDPRIGLYSIRDFNKYARPRRDRKEK